MLRPSFYIQVIIFSLVRMVIHTGLRMVIPFLPAIGRGLGVDLASMALAVSISMLAGIAGPLFAPLADRLGRRKGMMLGLAGFTIGMAFVVAIPTYTGFVVGLVLAGAGSAVFVPVTQAYTGDIVPYEKRGTVMSMIEYSWGMSLIIGIPLVGLIINRLGWRAPFPIVACLALVGLVVIYFLVPVARPSKTRPDSLQPNLKAILAFPPAMFALLFGFFAGGGNEIVTVVYGAWLEDVYLLEVAVLGAVSIVIGLSEVGGESLAAWLVDRLGKEKAIGLGLVINSLTFLILPLIGHSLVGGLVWLFIFYISFEFFIVSSLPLMTEIYPQGRATLMGFYLASWTFGRAFGALVGPALYARGFWVNVLACTILNLIALLALSRVRFRSVDAQ